MTCEVPSSPSYSKIIFGDSVTAMQALGGPSSLQSQWEFSSAVHSPHENRFLVQMKGFGEPLSFLACADWDIGATREETLVAGEKELGLVIWCCNCGHEALG